jgi:hypothetical protein
MTSTADALVPDSWRTRPPAHAPEPPTVRLEPVKRLMVAVLDRAVNDYLTYAAVPTPRARRIFHDVETWFHAAAAGPFDFETICEATQLDPEFVRKGLRSASGTAGAGTRR